MNLKCIKYKDISVGDLILDRAIDPDDGQFVFSFLQVQRIAIDSDACDCCTEMSVTEFASSLPAKCFEKPVKMIIWVKEKATPKQPSSEDRIDILIF